MHLVIRDRHWGVVATVATVATVAMMDIAFAASCRDDYRVLRFCHLTIYVYLKGLKKDFAGIAMIANTFPQNPRPIPQMQRLYL